MKKRLEKKVNKLKELKNFLYFSKKAKLATDSEESMIYSSLSLTSRERADLIDVVIERTMEIFELGQKSRTNG